MSKYSKGLCRWKGCQEKRQASLSANYSDETWILPFYCKKHGKIALARRLARLARIQSSYPGRYEVPNVIVS